MAFALSSGQTRRRRIVLHGDSRFEAGFAFRRRAQRKVKSWNVTKVANSGAFMRPVNQFCASERFVLNGKWLVSLARIALSATE
ncbi:hypothetical protein [Slackia sp.]|uniref:hypothetical protein n=1 Tax=Slackia sp. TaxID=2049041 RepID=UPI00257E04FB|nr:hypothetical protein [Slackia sp.]MBS6499589.1 hypothetical protein [Slackia sp.]